LIAPSFILSFLSMLRPPPTSTLFPYTTLFRSDARKMIVDGAVGMVEMALERLSENNVVELDDERKAAMVSNLLVVLCGNHDAQPDRKSTRLNSSHVSISYAVFCLKKKTQIRHR